MITIYKVTSENKVETNDSDGPINLKINLSVNNSKLSH